MLERQVQDAADAKFAVAMHKIEYVFLTLTSASLSLSPSPSSYRNPDLLVDVLTSALFKCVDLLVPETS